MLNSEYAQNQYSGKILSVAINVLVPVVQRAARRAMPLSPRTQPPVRLSEAEAARIEIFISEQQPAVMAIISAMEEFLRSIPDLPKDDYEYPVKVVSPDGTQYRIEKPLHVKECITRRVPRSAVA